MDLSRRAMVVRAKHAFASSHGRPSRLASARSTAEKAAVTAVVAEDQFVSWSQPYSSVETGDRDLLFFLPNAPVGPENRTLYVGLNRVVSPIGGQNLTRNGCGLRRAIITVH